MYVQRDDHRVGLVRLLTIALRVLTLLEGFIRKNLQEQKREITGLYAGNPKRRTYQPTAEQVLKAFDEVTLAIVHTSEFVQRYIKQLSSLQQQILSLLGFTPAIYVQLADDSWFPSGKWANHELRDQNIDVTDVLVIIDRQLERKKDGPCLEKKYAISLHALITMGEIIEHMIASNAVTQEQIVLLTRDYRQFERWRMPAFCQTKTSASS